MLFEKNSSILDLDSIQKVECRLCGSGRTKHWGEFTEDDREPSFSNPSANLVDMEGFRMGRIRFFAVLNTNLQGVLHFAHSLSVLYTDACN